MYNTKISYPLLQVSSCFRSDGTFPHYLHFTAFANYLASRRDMRAFQSFTTNIIYSYFCMVCLSIFKMFSFTVMTK